MYSMEDIPIGAENAISRKQLANKWGVSDRIARSYIARLREQDNGDRYVIVSHSDGCGGYYRTEDPAQIRHFYNETMNRARNTFKPLKKVRRVLKEIGT